MARLALQGQAISSLRRISEAHGAGAAGGALAIERAAVLAEAFAVAGFLATDLNGRVLIAHRTREVGAEPARLEGERVAPAMPAGGAFPSMADRGVGAQETRGERAAVAESWKAL